MVTCPRCKGKGVLPLYSHVYNGVCFRCKGEGNVLTVDEQEKVNHMLKQRQQKVEIKKLKETLAALYNAIHHSAIKSPSLLQHRREEAKKVWAKLKALGETPTLEEIQELAAQLR